MPTYSFFDEKTGLLTGRTLTCRDARVARQGMPDGQAAIEGALDHLSQKVDVAMGRVVDYQPPKPSDNHEWRDRRWVLKPEVAERQTERARAYAKIAMLEREQTPRMQREAALGKEDAKARLQAIEDQIETQRAVLRELAP